MKKFMLLHGVNHNMFGKRNPEQYGTVTLDEINENVQRLARELGVSVTCFQTNDEGKMVDKIHEAYTEHYDGVMINAGAWTHYSYGISDALEMLECPLIELHMSNIHKREEFRHHSVISPSPPASSSAWEPTYTPLACGPLRTAPRNRSRNNWPCRCPAAEWRLL